jgi:hypothetical protein
MEQASEEGALALRAAQICDIFYFKKKLKFCVDVA